MVISRKTLPLDYTGLTFGKLLVLGWVPRPDKHGVPSLYWRVRCECGKEKEISDKHIHEIVSCGCARGRPPTHGRTESVEYKTYLSAKYRCINPNSTHFDLYGGRGIEFRFTSFEQWHKELGDRPSPKHSVDRIDNNGHYEPGNVRWATPAQQRANQRKLDLPRCKGEDHPFAKFTEADIIVIRRLVAAGYSRKQLMQEFQMGSSTVSSIVNRRSWKHVP